jgi:Fic family protein
MGGMPAGAAHKWAPIEDLPEDCLELASDHLDVLREVWLEHRQELEASGALARFHDRLRREWAIETGVIERVYSLDRGVTEILIERGIDSSLIPQASTDKDPELVTAIIRDHEAAVDWLFDVVRGDRQLSTSFVKELHALMTRHQTTASARDQFGQLVEVELRHGEWKTLPNNPTRPDGTVHEYCPPEQVGSEMDRLVDLHLRHDEIGVPPEVEAAWLHHRFTQIHPFQDGNGRVARAITSLVFVRSRWFPLVVTRDDRESYLDALERADDGHLGGLVQLFERLQKRSFAQALSVGREALREGERLEQVIASLADIFAGPEDRALRGEWERAKTLADHVLDRARHRLSAVGDQLRAATGQRFYVDVHANGTERSQWHRAETVEIAQRHLDYFANNRDYRAWARLELAAEREAAAFVLLSLTGVGREFRGVVGASLAFFRREQAEEGQQRIVDLTAASDELFQISYKDDEESVLRRFDSWLERGLTCALAMWRQGLPGGSSA